MSAEIKWWAAPPDDNARDGVDLLELLDDEIQALVKHHVSECWVAQQMEIQPSESSESVRRWGRWLSYHQARIRQYKMLQAEFADEAAQRKAAK